MKVQEIPPQQWPQFFKDFTTMHHGRLVNIESLGAGFGTESAVRNQPLVAVADLTAGDQEWIEFVCGRDSAAEQVVTVRHPVHVRVATEDDGSTVALEIDDTRALATMLRFQPSKEGMPPGFVLS